MARANSSVVVALVLFALSIPLTASAQGLQSIDTLVLVDANNTTIGRVFSPDTESLKVAFQVEGRVFVLDANKDGFEGDDTLLLARAIGPTTGF